MTQLDQATSSSPSGTTGVTVNVEVTKESEPTNEFQRPTCSVRSFAYDHNNEVHRQAMLKALNCCDQRVWQSTPTCFQTRCGSHYIGLGDFYHLDDIDRDPKRSIRVRKKYEKLFYSFYKTMYWERKRLYQAISTLDEALEMMKNQAPDVDALMVLRVLKEKKKETLVKNYSKYLGHEAHRCGGKHTLPRVRYIPIGGASEPEPEQGEKKEEQEDEEEEQEEQTEEEKVFFSFGSAPQTRARHTRVKRRTKTPGFSLTFSTTV